MTADQKIPKSIAALSVLSGVPEEDVAVQLACLLTAVGGPHAGLMTLGDEFQPVGFHVLQLGGDSARERRLLDLLFQPLRFIQEDLMAYSRLAPPEQLDWMARAYIEDRRSDEYLPFDPDEERIEGTARKDVYHLADLSSQAVSLTSPWRRSEDIEMYLDKIGCKTALPVDGIHRYLPGYPMLSQSYVGRNEGRCLYEPVLFLDNPGLEDLRKPWEGVDCCSPLILDETGRLWESCGRPADSRKALASILTGRTMVTASASGKERYRPRRAQVLSVIAEELGRQLLSEPAWETLIASLLLVRTPGGGETGDTELDAGQVEEGYRHYRRVVKGTARLRRLDATGLWWTRMNEELATEFHRRQLEFTEKLEAVDAGERPFTSGFSSLPVSMLWTISQLDEKKITSEDISLAMTWAEAAMRNHLTSLREFRRNAENEQIERKAAEMLWKLFEVEPASFRDLMRKYPVQRREVHEPVLNHLVESGKVLRLKDNKLRLADRTRARLVERSGDGRMPA